MKTSEKAAKNQGSALATVLVLIGVMSLVLAAMASAMWQRMTFTQDQGNYERAMAVAEAGASSAYVKLLDDLSLTNSPGLLSTNFGGGAYSVSTSIPAENILVITSVGTFGKETGIVGLNLEIDPDANDFDIYETKAGDAPCAIVADGKYRTKPIAATM